MKNIEIEIQVQVEDISPLVKFLNSNAKKKLANRQIDEYFVPKHRNFLAKKPIAEWLRLRNSNGDYSINYKNWHYRKDGKSDHCDEYETKLEDIEQIELILKSLDFRPIVTVDKIRASYLYKKYEISIDCVKGLGDYVEIEYKGKSGGKNAKEIADEMGQFLKKCKVGKIYKNYVGYPFQILFPEKIKTVEI